MHLFEINLWISWLEWFWGDHPRGIPNQKEWSISVSLYATKIAFQHPMCWNFFEKWHFLDERILRIFPILENFVVVSFRFLSKNTLLSIAITLADFWHISLEVEIERQISGPFLSSMNQLFILKQCTKI